MEFWHANEYLKYYPIETREELEQMMHECRFSLQIALNAMTKDKNLSWYEKWANMKKRKQDEMFTIEDGNAYLLYREKSTKIVSAAYVVVVVGFILFFISTL